jgi:hypothetical protein
MNIAHLIILTLDNINNLKLLNDVGIYVDRPVNTMNISSRSFSPRSVLIYPVPLKRGYTTHDQKRVQQILCFSWIFNILLTGLSQSTNTATTAKEETTKLAATDPYHAVKSSHSS